MKQAISIILTLAACSVYAQNSRSSKDTLTTDEVLIVREYEPTISNAFKIGITPQIKEVKAKEITFKYDEKKIDFNSGFKPDSIQAARIKAEALNRLYRNYVKLGMGNYLTTYGEAHINSVRSRNGYWGANLKHRASQGQIANYPYSGFSRNSAEVHGTRFLKSHEVNGKINYSRDANHFYGFADSLQARLDESKIEKAHIEQIYHLVSAQAGVSSFFKDSNALNYRVNTRYNYLTTQSQANENQVVLDAKLERYFGSELALLNIKADYNQFQNNDTNSNFPVFANTGNLLILINPQVEFKGEKWRLSAGLNAFIENDSNTQFKFYPNAMFSYNVYDNYVIPYAGVRGGIERLNFNSLRQENPFISNFVQLQNTNTRYDFFGGVRGALTSNVSFNLRASYRQLANMPLFVHTNRSAGIVVPTQFNREDASFIVRYDTVQITQITGELVFFEQSKLNVMLRGDYYAYNTTRETKAWHMPAFVATASGRYNLRNKLVFTSDVTFNTVRQALTFDPNEGEKVSATEFAVNLDAIVDLNLGFEFRYNKKLSGFLQLNNILAQQYERWHNYPVQRFNLLFGVTYSFWRE